MEGPDPEEQLATLAWEAMPIVPLRRDPLWKRAAVTAVAWIMVGIALAVFTWASWKRLRRW